MSTELEDWHRQNEALAKEYDPQGAYFEEKPFHTILFSNNFSVGEPTCFDRFKAKVEEVITKYPDASITASVRWLRGAYTAGGVHHGGWGAILFSSEKIEGGCERLDSEGRRTVPGPWEIFDLTQP